MPTASSVHLQTSLPAETSAASPIAILLYHALYSDPRDLAGHAAAVAHYWFPVTEFECQMKMLAERGFQTVRLSALLEPASVVAHPLVITFDDGWQSDRHWALPILSRLGWTAECFVTVSWVEKPGFVSWRELSELADAGFGIQSHSMTHADLGRLPRDTLRYELEASKAIIEDRIGHRVDFLALPGGAGANVRVVQVARSLGYRGICTSRVGLNRPGADPFAWRRVPVTRRTSIRALEAWVEGEGLRALALRRTMYRVAQRWLGRKLYGWLKERLLR